MGLLIILDLDETLILATETPLDRACDFRCDAYSVYLRPGVFTFLDRICTDAEVALWSSATEDYVDCMMAELFAGRPAPAFAWSRRQCTLRIDPETGQPWYLKKLKKIRRLGYRLEQTLMIDDDPRALAENYGNLVRVRPYDGRPVDNELDLLARYIGRLRGSADLRRVEKRGWRNQIARDNAQ